VSDEDEDDDGPDGLVPYAPEFTPATLGKTLGEDNVLQWLLQHASTSGHRATLQQHIADGCLTHIAEAKNRLDMARHVVLALQGYQLILIDDEDQVRLTDVGAQILAEPAGTRDAMFGRHILTMCNGYRLVEAIHRIELSGQKVEMEQLSQELDRSATSKNLSTMKAWLERAGVMLPGRRYTINDARVEELLGRGAFRLLGFGEREVEFLLAARVQATLQTDPVLEAADVKALAEMRRPDVRLPSKALASFARGLATQGLIVEEPKARSKGGTRFAFRLSAEGIKLTDEQVRKLVEQAWAGMPLAMLRPLDQVLAVLATGTTKDRGELGEMLAVHACLMLGLRVVAWRQRTPAHEIDLTAERTVGLSYQRWRLQVKNIDGDLDTDRVDREVGAAAGTGATHLLFIVPRGSVTGPAQVEIGIKNKLTHLHVYLLTAGSFAAPVNIVSLLIRELRGQETKLTSIKRMEAERRELL